MSILPQDAPFESSILPSVDTAIPTPTLVLPRTDSTTKTVIMAFTVVGVAAALFSIFGYWIYRRSRRPSERLSRAIAWNDNIHLFSRLAEGDTDTGNGNSNTGNGNSDPPKAGGDNLSRTGDDGPSPTGNNSGTPDTKGKGKQRFVFLLLDRVEITLTTVMIGSNQIPVGAASRI